MVKNDDHLPATKRELRSVNKKLDSSTSELRTEIGGVRDDLNSFKKETAINFAGLAERITVETEKLREEMKVWREEIKHHFEVIAENLVHDIRGITRDEDSHLRARVSDHEKRLVRLERAR